MTATATTSHTPGKLKERKDELYAGFAAGRTDKELSAEFEVHSATISYHRKQWEKTPKAKAAPVIDPPPVAEPPAAPPPTPKTEPVAATTESAPKGDRPATREEIEKLAKVLKGEAPRPQDAASAPKGPVVKGLPTVAPVEQGRIYEGAIFKIEWNFALIDLIELADPKGRCPRGKVGLDECGLPHTVRDLRDARQYGFKEGALVYAGVLSAKPDPNRAGRQLINLSLDQAPGHPEGYTPPSHFPRQEAKPKAQQPEPEAQKVEDEATQAALLKAQEALAKAREEIKQLAETVEGAVETCNRLTAERDEAIDQANAAEQRAAGLEGLCVTCVKADICPFVDLMADSIEPESKPGRLAVVEILYGPRPVTKCSSYVKAGG